MGALSVIPLLRNGIKSDLRSDPSAGDHFIPILGALAVAFCLAREMRGSLISCMVAHGINNGLVVGLNIAMAG